MAFQFTDFVSWMPLDYEFSRMTDNSDTYSEMTYEQFVEWNRECFNSASDEERGFLKQICMSITNGRIGLMDLESCSQFQASGVYFNPTKMICIFNPR